MKCDLLELLNFTHTGIFYCPTRQAAARVFHFQMSTFRLVKIARNALVFVRGRWGGLYLVTVIEIRRIILLSFPGHIHPMLMKWCLVSNLCSSLMEDMRLCILCCNSLISSVQQKPLQSHVSLDVVPIMCSCYWNSHVATGHPSPVN